MIGIYICEYSYEIWHYKCGTGGMCNAIMWCLKRTQGSEADPQEWAPNCVPLLPLMNQVISSLTMWAGGSAHEE